MLAWHLVYPVYLFKISEYGNEDKKAFGVNTNGINKTNTKKTAGILTLFTKVNINTYIRNTQNTKT